jgi:hypothetical protein
MQPPTNGTVLKHITTCKLCGQRFSNNALPVIGDVPDAATQNFVKALIKHLKIVHARHFAQFTQDMIVLSDQFAGWLALRSFQTEDPNLAQSQEILRKWVHSITRKNQLFDADLLDRVSRLGLSAAEAEPVTALCKELRDYLTEQGPYAGN